VRNLLWPAKADSSRDTPALRNDKPLKLHHYTKRCEESAKIKGSGQGSRLDTEKRPDYVLRGGFESIGSRGFFSGLANGKAGEDRGAGVAGVDFNSSAELPHSFAHSLDSDPWFGGAGETNGSAGNPFSVVAHFYENGVCLQSRLTRTLAEELPEWRWTFVRHS